MNAIILAAALLSGCGCNSSTPTTSPETAARRAHPVARAAAAAALAPVRALVAVRRNAKARHSARRGG